MEIPDTFFITVFDYFVTIQDRQKNHFKCCPASSEQEDIMSVLMSLMDFIPVILFIISSITLQRCVYYRMSKGAFAVFSAGMIMIICSGIFKAIWKLFYSLGICDFERLNQSFFPMQSVGFLLAGTATIAMVFFRQDNGEKLYQIGMPTVFSGTILFIAANILGSLGLCGGLAIESKRCGKVRPAVFFILSFFFLLTLGYLGTKDFTNASVNWTSEAVNILAQIFFLLASKEFAKQ